MCGIIISSIDIKNKDNVYKYVKNRGPDRTHEVTYKGINFVHFLLHLTGELTVQPLIENDILCLFNGEIYNYKDINTESRSDIHSIIKAYKMYGENFVKKLDGEFVIILFDFKKNKLIVSSDIFKTKPLFYNISKENIVISSYISACKKIKNQEYKSIKPNETLIFDLKTREIIKKMSIYDFDLEQKKENYNDYIKAFEKAVLKRYPEKNIPLVTLSSGLDSGAIACCLKKYNKKALYVSIPKNENIGVINKRKEILGDEHLIKNLTNEEKVYWKKDLVDKCEKFVWDWRYHIRLTSVNNGFDMGSMLGKSKMIDISKKYNKDIRILYSGIGADEVMAHNSYYSCGWGNVDYFPKKLEDVYPWANFYNGSMENYLKGDEYVGGCYGYETRYPFCDKDLVQEFLWLKPELKNKFKGYILKPALLYYLDKESFPYHIKKLGFNV